MRQQCLGLYPHLCPSLLLTLVVALPVCAVEGHHPGPADAATGQLTQVTPAPAMQADLMKMDAAIMQNGMMAQQEMMKIKKRNIE